MIMNFVKPYIEKLKAILDFPHYGRHRYSLIKHSGGNDGKGTVCGGV